MLSAHTGRHARRSARSMAMRVTTIAFVLVSACAYDPGQIPTDDGSGGDDGDTGSGDGGETDPCATAVSVPLAGRPLDLMPPAQLAEVASRLPCIAPGTVRSTIESPRTLWYDKHSL